MRTDRFDTIEALALRGVGGEAENARRLLERLEREGKRPLPRHVCHFQYQNTLEKIFWLHLGQILSTDKLNWTLLGDCIVVMILTGEEETAVRNLYHHYYPHVRLIHQRQQEIVQSQINQWQARMESLDTDVLGVFCGVNHLRPTQEQSTSSPKSMPETDRAYWRQLIQDTPAVGDPRCKRLV